MHKRTADELFFFSWTSVSSSAHLFIIPIFILQILKNITTMVLIYTQIQNTTMTVKRTMYLFIYHLIKMPLQFINYKCTSFTARWDEKRVSFELVANLWQVSRIGGIVVARVFSCAVESLFSSHLRIIILCKIVLTEHYKIWTNNELRLLQAKLPIINFLKFIKCKVGW